MTIKENIDSLYKLYENADSPEAKEAAWTAYENEFVACGGSDVCKNCWHFRSCHWRPGLSKACSESQQECCREFKE